MSSQRLHGLDVARFFAFAGMVLVNFHVVMGNGTGAGWATGFLYALEGKAAATFVLLAGLGFGLSARRGVDAKFYTRTLKRAAFLLIIGLINALIFPADILHFYAIYFLVGLLLIKQSLASIMFVAVLLPIASLIYLLFGNYDAGWNWITLDYIDFWTVGGFFRNLFLNGWHPVLPWASFFLVGMVLSHLNLSERTIQTRLLIGGASLIAATHLLSFGLVLFLDDPELATLVQVGPVPPSILYMIAGVGSGMLVIGFCLFVQPMVPRLLKPLALTGRQALTLYVAHIIIGMGAIEALGWITTQPSEMSIYTSIVFVAVTIAYAVLWSRLPGGESKPGPLEYVMRRLTG